MTTGNDNTGNSTTQGINTAPKRVDTYTSTSAPEYEKWVTEPTPQNMSKLLSTFDPLINSEIQRYAGPKPLLRSKAKVLAIGAVRSYDPASGARLRSWVTTQLQPLSRYGKQLRPVYAPEVAVRQAAEVARVRKELSDDLGRDPTDEEISDTIGISVKRVEDVQRMVIPAMSTSSTESDSGDDDTSTEPGVKYTNVVSTAEDMLYSSLDVRDRKIFDWKTGRKGEELSNQEIAHRLGVTPALISQRTKNMGETLAALAGRAQ